MDESGVRVTLARSDRRQLVRLLDVARVLTGLLLSDDLALDSEDVKVYRVDMPTRV